MMKKAYRTVMKRNACRYLDKSFLKDVDLSALGWGLTMVGRNAIVKSLVKRKVWLTPNIHRFKILAHCHLSKLRQLRTETVPQATCLSFHR